MFLFLFYCFYRYIFAFNPINFTSKINEIVLLNCCQTFTDFNIITNTIYMHTRDRPIFETIYEFLSIF